MAPSIDAYGNPFEPQQPRLNQTEIFENQQIAAHDAAKFRYVAKTKVGAVPTQAVVNQLRIIAKILEESKVPAVTFTLEVNEASKP